MMANEKGFLFISDLQIPFEAPNSLAFCKAVQKEFKIPPENVYNVGDEIDFYHGTSHPKSPDATLTANQELDLTIDRLKEWYKAFPQMKLALSNHGMRWKRKAFHSDIPARILKKYRDLIEAPIGWQWRKRWDIKTPSTKISMIHGMGYSGINAHRNAAIDLGCNVVHGHLHSNAGISWIANDGRKIYGMNVGCLIDVKSFAFEYGSYSRHKPVLSVGIAIDDGLTPIIVPYERF